MQIPFSGPLGPTNGKSSDGCLHSSVPYEKPLACVSSSVAKPVSKIIRGNSDGAGGITYEDVTAAMSAVGGSTTTVFDLTDPNGDQVWVEIDEDETIVGFGLYVTGEAVFDGTSACTVKYKNLQGAWVDVACTHTGAANMLGMVYINFDPILGSQLALQDSLIDPVNGEQSHKFVIGFSGIENITVAPIIDTVFKLYPDENKSLTDLTSFIVDDVADIPAAYETLELFAHAGDRTLFAVEKPFAKMKINLSRERLTPDCKLVYLKADGTFGDVEVVTMPSASAARPGQWGTVDPGATPVEYVDVIIPPADWGEESVTVDGTAYVGYWFGIEYTAGSDSPELAMLLTVHCGQFKGTDGVRATENISSADIRMRARETSDTDSHFIAVNLDTGESRDFLLSADEGVVESLSTGLTISDGNYVAIQQLSGSEVSVPSDGFISITA